jgi:hypothetical protein
MKRALLGLLVACTTLGLASVALAGENANAGISLHITKPTSKIVQCPAFAAFDNASDPFDTKGQPCSNGNGSFDVWVVICNGSDSVGLAGAEFGIEYDGASGSGVDIEAWKTCADLEFPQDDWPASGSGNLVTWAECQMTNLVQNPPLAGTAYAVAGVFTVSVYGQDQMEVTTRPVSGRMKVADCLAVEDDITDALVSRGGIATFCTNRQGYNYCKGKKLDGGPTTWGTLKNMYPTSN